jgi:hypothetical protein
MRGRRSFSQDELACLRILHAEATAILDVLELLSGIRFTEP